jgi:hypothetical protein
MIKKLLLAIALAVSTPALADEQPIKYSCTPVQQMQEIVDQAGLHLIFRGKSPTSDKYIGFLFSYDQPVIMAVEFDDKEACIIAVGKDSEVNKEQMKKLSQITIGDRS